MEKILIAVALATLELMGMIGVVSADTTTIDVSATVVGVCKFKAGGKISFTFDMLGKSDVVGTVTQPAFLCTKGTAYTISDDKGLHSTNKNVSRMKHATLDEYIPYLFTYSSNGTGKGNSASQEMNLSAKVLGKDYIDVSAGKYTDIITLTITP